MEDKSARNVSRSLLLGLRLLSSIGRRTWSLSAFVVEVGGECEGGGGGECGGGWW